MKNKREAGCLFCRDGKNSFSHSGAANVGMMDVVWKGNILLKESFMSYPEIDIVKCEICDSIWKSDYYYPDKPPLQFSAKIVDESLIRIYKNPSVENFRKLVKLDKDFNLSNSSVQYFIRNAYLANKDFEEEVKDLFFEKESKNRLKKIIEHYEKFKS